MKESNSISLLIGAGFSAPMGYPVGNKLNEFIGNCGNDVFAFHTSGALVFNRDGSKPDFGYKTSYDIQFDFLIDLINFYKQNIKKFDYEEFYDFLIEDLAGETRIDSIAKKYIGISFTKRTLLSGLSKIYVQIIGYYLKDSDGKKWYDDEPYVLDDYFHGYTGIMSCLKAFSKDNILNIHSLNHDLLFERFNSTDFFSGNLSDGFEEMGSPFYGKISIDGRAYMCRLSRYTGEYKSNIRLFKLHGSRDYLIYYGKNGAYLVPEVYVKTRYGVGTTELFKEVEENGHLKYDNCWINYHSDFLTGTTSKIERYAEPFLFKKLFQHFKENLKSANKLIIIGYGAKDSEVNNIITENFNFKNKPSIIIDPYAGDKVAEFGKALGSKMITKQLEDISLLDLE